MIAVLVLATALAGIWLAWRFRSDDGLGTPQAEPVQRALANLQPVGPGHAHGSISFARMEDGNGLRIAYTVRGLPPGAHSLHILESGDCSAVRADLDSGRGSNGSSTSSTSRQDDLGDLFANELGYLQGALEGRSLSLGGGPGGILGRPLVITAWSSSGSPIACGLIRSR